MFDFLKNSLLPGSEPSIEPAADMSMAWQLVLVGLGGAIGAMTRYYIQNLPYFGNDKFYYTLFINLTGCTFIGIVWAFLTNFDAHRWVYAFIIGGFLGGYTTYSAFTLDFILLLRVNVLKSLVYGGVMIFGAIGGCALSYAITNKILKAITA